MNARQTTSTRYQPVVEEDAKKLADFVLFTQSSCILNLSPQLNNKRVSYPQFFLLACLEHEEALTMSGIAKKMGHSTAASTGMVNKLEEMGYITRSPSPSDRRKIMVCITKEGKELVSSMHQNIVQELVAILQRLDRNSSSAQQLAQVRQTLLKYSPFNLPGQGF